MTRGEVGALLIGLGIAGLSLLLSRAVEGGSRQARQLGIRLAGVPMRIAEAVHRRLDHADRMRAIRRELEAGRTVDASLLTPDDARELGCAFGWARCGRWVAVGLRHAIDDEGGPKLTLPDPLPPYAVGYRFGATS